LSQNQAEAKAEKTGGLDWNDLHLQKRTLFLSLNLNRLCPRPAEFAVIVSLKTGIFH